MNLRVLQREWDPFVEELCDRSDVETAGVILAERLQGGEVLLARRMLVVPEQGGYLTRRIDRVQVDPIILNRLMREARDRGWSVLTVHTHPGTDRPWFSAADDAGDARLMPSLFAQMPGPHGSLVLAGSTGAALGRIWMGEQGPEPLSVRCVGSLLRVHATLPVHAPEDGWFDRQRLALEGR